MYLWIAKRKLRAGYAAISRADFESVVSAFHPQLQFHFVGQHAMGSTLTRREQVLAWFQRVHRLFPDLKIEAESVHVTGTPLEMIIMARFRVSATLPDGTPYINQGMQWAKIRMGKVIEDVVMEDTAVLIEALQRLAALGNAEAVAPPLTD